MGTTPSKIPARPEAQEKRLKQVTRTNYLSFKGEGKITIVGSINDLSAFEVKHENLNAILNLRGFFELSDKRKQHDICNYSYCVSGQFDRGILCDGPGSYSFVIETNTKSFAYKYTGSFKNGCKDGEGSCSVWDGETNQHWSYKGYFSQNWFSGIRSQSPNVIFEECEGQFLFDKLSVRFQSSYPSNQPQNIHTQNLPPSPSQKYQLSSADLSSSQLNCELSCELKVIGKLANQHLQLAKYCHYLGDLTNGKHGAGEVKYVIQFSSNDLVLVKSLNHELFEQCNIATIMKMCELGYSSSKNYCVMVLIKGKMDGNALIGEGQIECQTRHDGGTLSYTYQGSFINGRRHGNGALTFSGGLQSKCIDYKGHFNHTEFTGTLTNRTRGSVTKVNEEVHKIKLIYDGLVLTSDFDQQPDISLKSIDLTRTVKLSDCLTYNGICAEDGHDHGHGYGKYSITLYPNAMTNAWPFHPFFAPFTLDNIIKCKDLPTTQFTLPAIESSHITIEGTFDGHSLSGLGNYSGMISNGMYLSVYNFSGNFEKGVKMGPGTFTITDSGKYTVYEGNFRNNSFEGTSSALGCFGDKTHCKGEFISAGAFILFSPCQDVSNLRIQIPSVEISEIKPMNSETSIAVESSAPIAVESSAPIAVESSAPIAVESSAPVAV